MAPLGGNIRESLGENTTAGSHWFSCDALILRHQLPKTRPRTNKKQRNGFKILGASSPRWSVVGPETHGLGTTALEHSTISLKNVSRNRRLALLEDFIPQRGNTQ
ncbi:hypothetical protein AVEN_33155-1 [Araneus ventricosus]|uniref:Uncharacterized protein n=1 Tax=Araneus ventricosus TaxID=182803 RepID=A0A4Y2LGF8_ARAVE|nr:hypothetical protein AVEN_33155-1 [Araneus ventricosus]